MKENRTKANSNEPLEAKCFDVFSCLVTFGTLNRLDTKLNEEHEMIFEHSLKERRESPFLISNLIEKRLFNDFKKIKFLLTPTVYIQITAIDATQYSYSGQAHRTISLVKSFVCCLHVYIRI